MTDTVCHHFQKNRAATIGEGETTGLSRGTAHGEDVVAVNAEGSNTVACAAGSDAVTAVLVGRGS